MVLTDDGPLALAVPRDREGVRRLLDTTNSLESVLRSSERSSRRADIFRMTMPRRS
jgi:hypothetical protein